MFRHLGNWGATFENEPHYFDFWSNIQAVLFEWRTYVWALVVAIVVSAIFIALARFAPKLDQSYRLMTAVCSLIIAINLTMAHVLSGT